MSRKTQVLLAIGVIAIVALGLFLVSRTEESAPPEIVGEMPETSAEVVVVSPSQNSAVMSPLSVSGKALGTWFFEANIRLQVLDGNGEIIGQGHGTATADWMTTDFVPFAGEVEFSPAPSSAGILRILNDNPSGLPEKEKHFDVPIVLGEVGAQAMTVKVYFGNSKLDPHVLHCETTYPVVRKIAKTQAVAEAAVKELLKGPTPQEAQGGYFSSLPADVSLNSVSITNGILRADFSDALNAVAGSCRVGAISSQIIETLKQFPTVQSVVISVNGRTEDILQP